MPVGVCDFVAVTVVPGGNSGGEASMFAVGSPELGMAEASTRPLVASEAVPSDELGDTEMTEAISTIKPVRQRMMDTDKLDARLERVVFMISSPLDLQSLFCRNSVEATIGQLAKALTSIKSPSIRLAADFSKVLAANDRSIITG